MRIEGLMWRTASGLPLLQQVVSHNARAWDFLLHPVRRVLVLLNLSGCHDVLRLPKANLLVLRGSREAVVELPPGGHASIVAVKDTTLQNVTLRRRVVAAMLQNHQHLLVLVMMGRMVKIPSVAN